MMEITGHGLSLRLCSWIPASPGKHFACMRAAQDGNPHGKKANLITQRTVISSRDESAQQQRKQATRDTVAPGHRQTQAISGVSAAPAGGKLTLVVASSASRIAKERKLRSPRDWSRNIATQALREVKLSSTPRVRSYYARGRGIGVVVDEPPIAFNPGQGGQGCLHAHRLARACAAC